jgi:F0F1-type ATP synthase epsilon subunit
VNGDITEIACRILAEAAERARMESDVKKRVARLNAERDREEEEQDEENGWVALLSGRGRRKIR